MKTFKTFVAMVALIGGAVILYACMCSLRRTEDDLLGAFVSVFLIAGGVTYLWRKSRFYRDDPKVLER